MKKATQKLLQLWMLIPVFLWVLPSACVLSAHRNPSPLFYNPTDRDFNNALNPLRVGDGYASFQYMTFVDSTKFDPRTGLFVPTTLGCNCSDDGGGFGGGFGGGSWGGSPNNGNGSSTNKSRTGTAPRIQGLGTAKAREADLIRMQGSTLFWLSESRGLLIFSLQNPKTPKKLAQLSITGRPIEMVVESNRAIIAVSHLVEWKKGSSPFSFKRQVKSKVLLVDLGNLRAPKVKDSLELDGVLKAGLIRQRGDVLYLATYSPKWTIGGTARPHEPAREFVKLHSILASGSSSLKKIEEHQLIDDDRRLFWQQHPWGINFKSIVLTMRDGVIMLAEQWEVQETMTFNNCSRNIDWPVTTQRTWLHLIDARHSSGTMKILKKGYTIRGILKDQFKQSFVKADSTKGHYYGVVSYRVSSSSCSSLVQNVIHSLEVSLTDGKIKYLDELRVGKPAEDVKGSLFDHKRNVLYVITATAMTPRDWKPQEKSGGSIPQFPPPPPFRTDPLYAISLKDPSQLKKLSDIDHLNGDISLFRTIANGRYLIAVGRDESQHCTGFEPSRLFNGSVRTRMAISLVDVRDLSRIQLVQRRCVEVNGLVGGMTSRVNDDRGQAHKISSVVDSDTLKLVMVPLTYKATHEKKNLTRTFAAVGMMSWNLKKFDPALSHKLQDVLQPVGTMLHVDGEVKRTIYLTPYLKDKSKHWIASLSDTALTVSELKPDKKIQTVGALQFAQSIPVIFKMGSVWVEQVVSSHDPFSSMRLNVREQRGGTLLKSFAYGEWLQVARWKNKLVVMTPTTLKKTNDEKPATRFEVIDFFAPKSPRSIFVANQEVILPKRLSTPGQYVKSMSIGAKQRNWWPLKSGIVFFGNNQDPNKMTPYNEPLQGTFLKLTLDEKTIRFKVTKTRLFHNIAKDSDNNFYTSRLLPGTNGVENYNLTAAFGAHQPDTSWGRTFSFVPGHIFAAFPFAEDSFQFLSFLKQGNLMRKDQDIFVRELRQARSRIIVSDIQNHTGIRDYRISNIFDFPGWSLRSTLQINDEGVIAFLQRSQSYLTDMPNADQQDKGSKLVYLKRTHSLDKVKWVVEKEIQTSLPVVRTFRYWKETLLADIDGEGLLVVPLSNGLGEPRILKTPGSPVHFEPTGAHTALVTFGRFGHYLFDLKKLTLQQTSTNP